MAAASWDAYAADSYRYCSELSALTGSSNPGVQDRNSSLPYLDIQPGNHLHAYSTPPWNYGPSLRVTIGGCHTSRNQSRELKNLLNVPQNETCDILVPPTGCWGNQQDQIGKDPGGEVGVEMRQDKVFDRPQEEEEHCLDTLHSSRSLGKERPLGHGSHQNPPTVLKITSGIHGEAFPPHRQNLLPFSLMAQMSCVISSSLVWSQGLCDHICSLLCKLSFVQQIN